VGQTITAGFRNGSVSHLKRIGGVSSPQGHLENSAPCMAVWSFDCPLDYRESEVTNRKLGWWTGVGKRQPAVLT
jgi:hypothetical protein